MQHNESWSEHGVPCRGLLQLPSREPGDRKTWGYSLHLCLAVSTLFGILVLSGCSGNSKFETVVVAGSTTVLPIAEVAAEKFGENNPECSVLVSGMGSSAGIEAVCAGTADVGTSSRNLKEGEGEGLTDIPIAHDGIAVIVNTLNPISEITSVQLREIYSGKIKNWKEIGGADLPIDLVNRDEASGTRDAFSSKVMEDTAFDDGAVILPGTGQVREVVSRGEGAIGYISVGFVKPRFGTKEVKSLVLDGIEPSEENVANSTYPISRVLHFFINGTPKGMVKLYIDYVLSDEVQNGAVTDAGYLPINPAGEGE